MRIGIVGHFGGKEKFNDGQTVKTVTLYQALLNNNVNGGRIHPIDTYYIRHNPLKFIGQMLDMVLFDKKVIILLSKNGRRILFPVMYFLSKYLKKEVYHYAIGGRLAREVLQDNKRKKYVSSFCSNWVESVQLRDSLIAQGVNNTIFLPNFKSLSILKLDDIPQHYVTPYTFCTFSRVMESKGITDAIKTIVAINKEFGSQIAKLDIYGPIENDYREAFEKELSNSEGACMYCGVVDSNKSVEALKNYFALLFPTHWQHEGIPGTIIDAFASGLPIISRRWQFCDEMITNGINGFVYEWDEPEKLKDMICYAIEHPREVIDMKKNCLSQARKYTESEVLKKICLEMKLE